MEENENTVVDPLAGQMLPDEGLFGPGTPADAAAAARSERVGWRHNFRVFCRHKPAVVGLVYVVLLVLASFLGPAAFDLDYEKGDASETLIPFSAEHPFGTDQQGRDLLVRNLYAARNAIVVAVVSVLVGLLLGALIGAFAGYLGGALDLLTMRLVDIMFAFPQILLLILLLVAIPDSMDRRISMFVAIGLTSWAGYARLIRGQVMQARNEDYVEAARCLGASNSHILRKYILPNIAGPIIVAVSFGIPSAMMAESGMSLIGLGLRPPMPSWGNLIYEGAREMLGFPHLVLWPSITFGLTLLAFTFIGDGLGGVYGKDR